MLQTVNNSEFSRTMDLFKEIDDLSDLFFPEKNDKLDSTAEGLEDLQNKYSSLHETYAKEIENSKKVEKCLIKCLKFYSKLCKKYEVQQKIIRDLEESIKEKVNSLEEAQRNEEKLKGLIEVYRTERTLYAGQTSAQLRKEKEILIDICCKLIGESVRSNNISNISSMLLRKFKKDLDSEKVTLLKNKSIKQNDEVEYNDLKPDFKSVKDEVVFNYEEKYEVKDPEEESKANLLDLMLCKEAVEERSPLVNENSCKGNDGIALEETEHSESGEMSSLPLLDEFPVSLQPPNNERQHECDVAIIEEFDSHGEESESDELPSITQIPNPNLSNSNVERGFEPQNSKEFKAPLSPLKSPDLPGKGSTSVFDISGFGDCPTEKEKRENSVEVSGLFDREERSEGLYFESCTDRVNSEAVKSDDDSSSFPYEKELLKIFREMTSVRMLSPIRESCSSVVDDRKNSEEGSSGSSLKRNASVEETHCKSKKLKSEAPSGCLLDSILSAMSIQNEEFKSKKFEDKGLQESDGMVNGMDGTVTGCSSEFGRLDTRESRRKRRESFRAEENSAAPCHSVRRSRVGDQGAVEKLVSEEIRNFVSSPMSCKEDADKNVRHCISVLKNKPEDVISKCIVATVFENIDEAVEIFERPAPPLTKTQHRLIVLLSVLRTLEWDSEKISSKILFLITEKLFPDNFFWPDDSVEAAVRFYAALCRAKNDPKTLWKFCLTAMTDMRQRCPLLVFTVLKTWPDVLHDASTLKNNMLAVTVVNIFLHMPKADGLRNVNQRRKLVALKHLLMNFYLFKVDDTIEGFAKKLLDAVGREEVGSEKSIVLLCKCRDVSWTMKNVMPGLSASLTDWAEEKLGDSVANTILSVIKQICPLLMQEKSVVEKVKDLAVSLSEILSSRKKSHSSEVNLIEILLLLKHFPEARKVIREWIPKNPICDSLRDEIINASADNILRELKLNRREPKNAFVKKKSWKKSKGGKKKKKKKATVKGKKGKKDDQKVKVCSRSQA